MNYKIAIIGVGRLGSSLAVAFKQANMLCAISDSDVVQGQKKADMLEVDFISGLDELLTVADVMFLTVPDAVIKPLASELASACQRLGITRKYFFHCSGCSGLEILDCLAQNQNVACVHPLQSFSGDLVSLTDIYMSIDGDSKGYLLAKELVDILGAQAIRVASADKALYHAAACIISNYTVALAAVAQDLFDNWQIPKEAFMSLLVGSVNNMLSKDRVQTALTGPISRGDAVTLKNHLDVLPQQYQSLYRELGMTTCALAKANNTINKEQYEKMLRVFKCYNVE